MVDNCAHHTQEGNKADANGNGGGGGGGGGEGFLGEVPFINLVHIIMHTCTHNIIGMH